METVVACVRHMVDGTIKREVRTFDTTTTSLLALADWLASEGCTVVAMEATGVYWKPVCGGVAAMICSGKKPGKTRKVDDQLDNHALST